MTQCQMQKILLAMASQRCDGIDGLDTDRDGYASIASGGVLR